MWMLYWYLILYLKTDHHVYHANSFFNLYIYIHLHIYIIIIVHLYRQNPDSLILPGDKWVFPPCQVGTSASQQGDYFQVFVFQKDDLAQIYPEKTKRPEKTKKQLQVFPKTEHGRLPNLKGNNMQYAINRCSFNSRLFCWVLLISCVLFFPVLVGFSAIIEFAGWSMLQGETEKDNNITYTSSSRASRWRKFQKKKELYSKERICL